MSEFDTPSAPEAEPSPAPRPRRAVRPRRKPRVRYQALDALRGLCLVSMILYHALYDLVAVKGYAVPWFFDTPGQVWQQSICWTFILLSGFCWQLSRNHTQRGLLLVACGTAITLVTRLVMPSQIIVYGILTLLGLSCLLANVLQLALEKLGWQIPPGASLAVSGILFLLTKAVPRGALGFGGLRLVELPAGLYQSPWLAVLGFPPAGFQSSDYFPLIPWFFLFAAGIFLYGLARRGGALPRLEAPGLAENPLGRGLTFLGRHSLLIYLLHQPVLMALFWFLPQAAS